MKRRFSLLVVALLAVLMAFSFACKPVEPTPGPGPGPGPGPDVPIKVVPEPKTQVDTREAVYTAYTADGTKIGDYKTIAEAINQAVATDSFGSDNSVVQLGSYVEYLGKTIFQNRNGFAEQSDDQFWFYLNGNQLEAYDCYDSVLYTEYLKNHKVITHEVVSRGSQAKQYHNGYAILTPDGQLATDPAMKAQSWELSSTMDAAALGFTTRLKGVTGLAHEIDLTNVQIKPNYAGTNDTYAYIGYYAWQDYYVIASGVACNVQTGAWYPFIGTSRDDSFSDVQYNLGDSPLMISNWNEEGGYWTPEYATLKMSIKTVQKQDDMGVYYVDESKYEFCKEDGTVDVTYEKVIDEAIVNEHFTGVAFGPENSFVFITGLDVRTPVAENGTTLNTDFTNGAEFKNVTVTKATAHVPSEEEFPEVDYGYTIKEELRGKDHNIVMASGDHVEGVYDYTLLNTYACAEYKAQDGADVYSFSYAGSNKADTAIGGKLAEYQGKIDQLGQATAETIVGMKAQLDEVEKMYANGDVKKSNILQKFYNVLNFEPYLEALELYRQNAALAEELVPYKEAFNALPSLANYAYVGWYTTEENATGYLKNDVLKFKALYDQYNTLLTAEQLGIWAYHVNIEDYNGYVDLMQKLDGTYFKEDFTITAKQFGNNSNPATFTGEEALAEIASALSKIAAGTVWDTGTQNDDPNNGKLVQMNSDNNWLPSYHVLYLKARLEDAGYQLPIYMTSIINTNGASAGFFEDFEYIDTVLTLAKGIQDGTYVFVTPQVAEMVNSVLVGKTAFVEGGLAWNWNASPNKDFLYRAKSYKVYYGLDQKDLIEYITLVQQFLTVRVGAEVDGIGIKANVEAEKVEISEDVAKVIAQFSLKLIHGAAFEKYDAAMAAYNALSEADQMVVKGYSDFEEIVELIEGTKNALEAVVLTDVAPLKTYTQYYFVKNLKTKEFTAKEALYQLNELLYKVAANDSWVAGVESDNNQSLTRMEWDVTAFQSIRIVVLTQYFQKANVTLPKHFAPLYEAIQYENFLDAYDSIYQTIRLTETYVLEGKTVADMTEEDKAVFEKYWGPDYKINTDLNWNWNTGNKFEMFFSERVRAIAYQYYLETNTATNALYSNQETQAWIYGDAFYKYDYKGKTYYSYVYEDEAALRQRDYTALYADEWGTKVMVDAEGNVVAEGAEGATHLKIDAAGVKKLEGIYVGACTQGPFPVYQLPDGTKVYKEHLGGGVLSETNYVDVYNRPLDQSIDVATITPVYIPVVNKYYAGLAAWLEGQGYTINANGWGYTLAPQAQA